MEWLLLKVVKLNCINKSGVKWSGYSKKMFITRMVLDRHVYFFTPTPLTPLDSTTPLGQKKEVFSGFAGGFPQNRADMRGAIFCLGCDRGVGFVRDGGKSTSIP